MECPSNFPPALPDVTDPYYQPGTPPGTRKEAIQRIVEWIDHAVQQTRDNNLTFKKDQAHEAWDENWGMFIDKQLKPGRDNPWMSTWKNIASVAMLHAEWAIKFARDRKRDHISKGDFISAGVVAAFACHSAFVAGNKDDKQHRGCWCNDC
jgi:hypothetical protein